MTAALAAAKPATILPTVRFTVDPIRRALPAMLALGLLHRLAIGWQTPLWFDETFSAVIASQPDARSLLRWCLSEIGGPVYYTMLWLWAKVAGNGDIALRLPSLLFSVAAPALLLWKGHPDRNVRLFWAALVAVWLPGLVYASEARSYALLFLLACGQSILFLNLLRQPGIARAAAWAALSSLMILTHYHALILAGLQGLAYLAIARGNALRSWPGALPFLPVAAWMWFHLPFVLSITGPDSAWQPLLTPRFLLILPYILMGGGSIAGILILLLASGYAAYRIWVAVSHGKALPAPEAALVFSGIAAVAVVVGMGFVQPSFVSRYLIPFMPAILFGCALWLRKVNRIMPMAAAALVVLTAVPMIRHGVGIARDPATDPRNMMSFERATLWFADARADRMIFLWDNPTGAASSPAVLSEVTGFFMARAGHPVPVSVARLRKGEDPNRMLLGRATGPRDAILWIYDRSVRYTAGIRHPNRIARIDPRWSCRNFGRGRIFVIACLPRSLVTP